MIFRGGFGPRFFYPIISDNNTKISCIIIFSYYNISVFLKVAEIYGFILNVLMEKKMKKVCFIFVLFTTMFLMFACGKGSELLEGGVTGDENNTSDTEATDPADTADSEATDPAADTDDPNSQDEPTEPTEPTE